MQSDVIEFTLRVQISDIKKRSFVKSEDLIQLVYHEDVVRDFLGVQELFHVRCEN